MSGGVINFLVTGMQLAETFEIFVGDLDFDVTGGQQKIIAGLSCRRACGEASLAQAFEG